MDTQNPKPSMASRIAAWLGKHVVGGVIAGLKAHPEDIAAIASMVATRSVNVAQLEKIGADVAVAGAASELSQAGQ